MGVLLHIRQLTKYARGKTENLFRVSQKIEIDE